MPEVFASNNLSIQYDATRWYLYNGGRETPPLVMAMPGGLTYTPAFAAARHLSDRGFLPTEDIVTVAVGFAAEDNHWHLGVLLTPAAAAERGARWCGLARWPGDQTLQAEQAGQALAALLERPYKLILPQPPDSALPPAAVEDEPPPLPLMPLPIRSEGWVLAERPGELRLSQDGSALRGNLIRAVFLIALAPIFVILSIGALNSVYAPVSPEWLPYVGLAVAAILVILAGGQLLNVMKAPITILERNTKMLKQATRVGGRLLLQSPFEGIDYVLISHTVGGQRPKPDKDGTPVQPFWAEVWIHAYSPRRGFIELCHLADVEGRLRTDIDFSARRSLHFGEIDSPAHHIGGWLAQEMDCPVYVEAR
jgi:hypothetical protein